MRRRSWVLFLFCLFTISLLLSEHSSASTNFRINEASTRLRLEDKETRISLGVENPTGRSFPAQVHLEVLDPEGKTVAASDSEEVIRRGNFALVVPLPLQLTNRDENEMLWYRLRYRLTPLASSAGAPATRAEGILSLSEITPDIFHLNVAAPEKAHAGTLYRAQVRALHPVTSRPVKGVRVEAELEFDADDDIADMKISRVTDMDGYAELDFDLPRKIEGDSELELKVSARRGILVEEAQSEIEVDRGAQILISTDKPLYQPGQVLHTRALIFDSEKRALAEREATLEIKDPEGKTVFTAELKTSRFGILNADWTIPDNIRLGEYMVKVEMAGDNDDDEGYVAIKISRYEIPNFAVEVKPDLPYYLPGQNASVEVRADYLFGQPVKRGHVRVVRQTDRSWNYREQKWETEEGQKYEGETDERGAFTAHIDLSEEHDILRGQDYARFRDLSYAAYFTDPTTNRTEQRRFDLRVTRSAIHVYLIETGSGQARDFPMQFYLSAYYADGTPAQCEVMISEPVTSVNPSGSSLSYYERPLRVIKTNRYGLAKVSNLSLTKEAGDERQATLTFTAHDGKGASARQTNNFWYSDHAVIRLETGKPLYRPREPIRVEVTASEPEMEILLDVWQGAAVLHSEVVRLRGGHASLTIPYRPEFKDTLAITAYAYGSAGEWSRYDLPSAMRRVLYPRERDLDVDVRLNQSTYKPGEDAHADFTVRDAAGAGVESALGVVVFDKAIEERARTDREFGSGFGFASAYRSLNDYEEEISGLTIGDFFKLDMSRPAPEGMELAAEVLLRGGNYSPHIFSSHESSLNQREIFSRLIARQLKPVEDALAAHYSKSMEHPNDEASLRRLLGASMIGFDQQLDPWGTPYRPSFHVERELDVLKFTSAGADKRFDTTDDFLATRMAWPYFRPAGETLNRVVEQYHKRTGSYIKDDVTAQAEFRQGGVDLSSLRDRWGKPYRLEFNTSGTNYTVAVKSGGPNEKFEDGNEASATDDFIVWTAFADYFSEEREEIRAALADQFKQTGHFPQSEKELRAQLSKADVELENSRDPWGRVYYVSVSNDPRFNAPFVIQTYSTYEEGTKKKREASALAQPNNLVRVRSAGADGVVGDGDDFDVAALSRKEIELLAKGGQPSHVASTVMLTGASGAVTGTLTDPQGAVVPNARVTATHASSSMVYETTTDDNGRFLLQNLPAGFYTIRFESPGFMTYVVEQTPVRSSNITLVDASLQVAGVMETVSVVSDRVDMISTGNKTISQSVRKVSPAEFGKSTGAAAQVSTPRLRDYFPETLVWQPLIETDARGRARVDFKLADNITTWKMAVIGSTINGEVGIVEKEIRAFQPFFVELDPPRVLTEGDEIQLPVVLRNYLDKSQAVDVEIKPEDWFAMLGPASKRAEVPSNDSLRETFGFRAVAPIQEGKQRITAKGSDASDAIEKSVSVHPYGEERALTTSAILGDSTTLSLGIPAETIKGSLRGELKIYPNLISHVAESVEGILERPHGCGEQTLSSTYPNLMILRFNKGLGLTSPVTVKARKYLEDGYKRLLNYRAESGGFSYWGGTESADFALTAYALRFLNDARDFLEVDEEVLGGARDFLIKQQRADGSWAAVSRYGASQDDPREDLQLTSYVARILASAQAKTEGSGNAQVAPEREQKPSTAALALKRALDYLSRHAGDIKDAYTLSAYALAAADARDLSGAGRAVAGLRSQAQADESGTISWEAETGTPFHGWGTAGRIETTALALQALNKYCGLQSADCGVGESPASPKSEIRNPQRERPKVAFSIPQLIDGALLYLLGQKDRHGVWQSTQATINVLDALIALSSAQGRGFWAEGQADGAGQFEIVVNGRPATSLPVPAGRLNNPIVADISPLLATGDNRILIRRGNTHLPASAQVVSTFYVPWPSARESKARNSAANPLRLAVNFSKSELAINEEVTCRVEAVGRNYGGMMLAEIGLPPGADVDRDSVELAVKNSGWSLSRYDVLPDRLLVYLWPRRDGIKFEFKFRPRYGLAAQTAPSLLYDYYNPEAQAIVVPVKFTVR